MYFPSWIPVNGPKWRLVHKRLGKFFKGKDGKSLAFETDQEALDYAIKHKVPLLPGLDKNAGAG
jgi:hypothetical protein